MLKMLGWLQVLGLMLFSANLAYGAWTASIDAEGEVTNDNVFLDRVRIGIAAVASELPEATPPPATSVDMFLYDVNDFAKLFEDIRADGETSYMWILSIDPNGNVSPPLTARTSTISWNPTEFGSGSYEMRTGLDGSGSVVVADMTTTTSYDVTGTQEVYFTIHYIPQGVGDINADGSVDIQDVILGLQLINNIEAESGSYIESDVNGDNKIGLEEAIYDLQVVSGLKVPPDNVFVSTRESGIKAISNTKD